MKLVVIAHNIRSAHNIGSIFRTSEGFGVEKLYVTGYSPYPKVENDTRPPYLVERLEKKIHKTALGAEKLVPFEQEADVEKIITKLKQSDYQIVGLEQVIGSTPINGFQTPDACALLLGEEVHGIPEDIQPLCDEFVEIPMHGKKQSFNVSVATGIALYALFYSHTVGAKHF